ncbi:Mg2+/Co2+ transporter CorB [Fluviicoccus keumensis]|uniref:Magnesium and cobalt efflux protein CorC n=1 Tax=Fluviicoccus keumensis TaxID=1435465 RepID=A0A4V2G667_9GAMM|nr:HlyC/CorC family transporter [Fluviicoccus keumensis]RZU47506.1 Mg2+/Co2+ transporter CorB [Fluviicoccus keumensis]
MDDTNLGLLFALLVVFILCSAFFSGSETGLMASNRYRLKHRAKLGERNAQRILGLLSQPDRLIGVILIGNTTVNTLVAMVATFIGIALASRFGVSDDVGATISATILTFVLLIFGEVGPKTFAANHPERVASLASYVLPALLKLFHPLVWVLNKITNALFRMNQGSHDRKDKLTRDELHTILQDVFLPTKHRNMLLGILELDNITVNDIMIPRQEVAGINMDDEVEDILNILRTTHHTRLPVYRGELNQTIGILHTRNTTRFLGQENVSKAEIMQFVREPYYVPESTPLQAQLLQFQKQKRRLGLVVDEYGDVQGIVTLEDILEEIVGEFTTNVADNHQDITPHADGFYVIDGSLGLRDINRSLHWQLPTDGAKTLSGLILEHLETIPDAALGLRLEDYLIEVMQIRDNTIKAARIKRVEAA